MRPKRTIVYLESDLNKALQAKAGETDQSLSELVSDAVRPRLLEDAENLAVFKQRAREPNLAFETVLKDLRRRGRLSAPHQAVNRQYRVRQGDYRVIYFVSDGRREVVVFKIGHRREVYA